MELKEAKERLQSLYEENADLLSGAFKYAGDTIYIDEDLANEYLSENEAIETVLEELNNSISKDKIKEEIEELEKLISEALLECGSASKEFTIYVHQQRILQDLLKEE